MNRLYGAPDGRMLLSMPFEGVEPVVGAVICSRTRGDDICRDIVKIRGVVTSVKADGNERRIIMWPVFVPEVHTARNAVKGVYASNTWAAMEQAFGYEPGTPVAISKGATMMICECPPPRTPVPIYIEGFMETFGDGSIAAAVFDDDFDDVSYAVRGLYGAKACLLRFVSAETRAAEDNVKAAEERVAAARKDMLVVVRRLTEAMDRKADADSLLAKLTAY